MTNATDQKENVIKFVELLNESSVLDNYTHLSREINSMTSDMYLAHDDESGKYWAEEYDDVEDYDDAYDYEDSKSLISDAYDELWEAAAELGESLGYTRSGCTSSLYLSAEDYEIRVSDHTDRHLEHVTNARHQVLLKSGYYSYTNVYVAQ